MKGKNVLADNPLDLMFASRRPQTATHAKPAETSETPAPSSVVSIDAGKRASVEAAVVEPVHAAAPERAANVVPAAPSSVESRVVPAAKAVTVEAPARAEAPIDDVNDKPVSRSRANRIGTLHQPYTRKKDGLETRQASVTLPVEVLRKVGHCAVDHGMKSSEIMRAAVEEYLAARGY